MSRKLLIPLAVLLSLAGLVGWTLGQSAGWLETAELRMERVSPRSVGLLTPGAGDAWDLWDSDPGSPVLSQDGAPVRLRVELPQERPLTGIGLLGGGLGRLTVLAADAEGTRSVEGLRDLATGSLGTGWKHLPLPQPFSAEALVLEWQPHFPGAALPEIELLGTARRALALDADGLPESAIRIDASLPVRRLGAGADTGAEPGEETEQQVLHFHLGTDPGTLARAFLIWEMEGTGHWLGVSRSINGRPALGATLDTAPASFPESYLSPESYLEEISPLWLQRGWNEVRLSGAPASTHVRLALIPEDGRLLVGGAEIAAPAPSALATALVDGDVTTGWTGESDPTASFPSTLELPFRRPAQPGALEVFLRDRPTGTLWVEAVDAQGTARMAREPVDLVGLRSGWNVLPLDPALPAATRLRLSWQNATSDTETPSLASPSGTLTEARLLASPVGSISAAPRLVLSYPSGSAAGGAAPILDGRVILRGFLQRFGASGGNPALYVDGGHVPGAVGLADGAFEVEIARGRGDERPVTVEALWPDGTRLARTIPVEDPTRSHADAAKKDQGGDTTATDIFRQTVTPGEASVIEHEGAKLEIPAGAVTEEVEITIEYLDADRMAGLDTGMTNVTDVHGCYRFGPDGMRFALPIRLTLPYDGGKVPVGHVDDDVQTWFFDEQAGRWLEIERVAVDPAAGTVTSLTDHFTDFVNATLTVPDSPSGTSFEASSIADLAEPDPAAGITLIEAPTGSPSGDATLSFPLELPPGRRGMAPELELTYNSAGGNGWLGLGWELAASSIEVDTRFGVPRYDDAQETETYLLDGAFLAPTAHTGEPRQAERIFTRRVEGSFERIVRHGSGPSNYWWEITDKNGTRRIYGQSTGARLADIHRSGNVFRWHLERMVDTHGNTVDFTYATDTGNNGEPWVETYLQSIQYTGGPGIAPLYQVVFQLDAADNPDQLRPDRLSSALPGFKTFTRHRLSHIDVLAGGALVRRYLLEYRIGDFSKSLLSAFAVVGRDGTSELARHRFDYFRMPTTGAGNPDGFEDTSVWGHLSSSRDATNRLEIGGGGHVFVGLGPPSCDPHGGVQVGASFTDSTTRVTFLDLNGDGLPDRIDDDGDAELNRYDPASDLGGFGGSSFDNTTTLEHGFDLSFDFGAGAHAFQDTVQAGVTWIWSNVFEDRTITDINGDGFPDLVNAFGGLGVRLNDGRGFSGNTSSWSGFTLDGEDLVPPEQRTEVLDNFKLSDTLRQLTLPYSGRIAVDGALRKLRSGGRDGVEAAIYHNGQRIWHHTFAPGDTAACAPALGNACGGGLERNVSAGDRLYFQTGSIAETEADDLLWAPRITYFRAPSPGCAVCLPVALSPEQRAAVEPFGAPVYVFDAGDDFRLAGPPGGGWSAPARGEVSIFGPLVKQTTADAVRASVVRLREGSPPSIVWTRNLAAPQTGTFDEVPRVAVEVEDVLVFHLASATQVDPARVSWTPQVSYEGGTLCQQLREERPEVCGVPVCDTATGECTVGGEPSALPLAQITLPAQVLTDVRRLFPRNRPTASWTAPSTGRHTLRVSRDDDEADGALLMVQGLHRLFSERIVPGSFDLELSLDLAEGDPVFVTTIGDTNGIGARIGAVVLPINERFRDLPELAQPLGLREEPLSGGYHGWFYGEWNGAETFRESALEERPDEGDSDFVAATPRWQGTDEVPEPVWIAAGFDLYHAADGGKPSRRGSNVVADLDFDGDGGGGGLGLIRYSVGRTAGADASAGVGGSLSLGDNTTALDFLDMNGDRYPDQVTSFGVRFSNGRGGFGGLETAASPGLEVRSSRDANVSVSIGLGITFTKKNAEGETEEVASALPSVGLAASASQSRKDLVDVNGDGLPDQVRLSPGSTDMKVRLNLGYRFGGEETWQLPPWSGGGAPRCNEVFQLAGLPRDNPNALRLTRSTVENAGIAIGPIGGGIGTTLSRTVVDLVDVNGDGLVDHVSKDDGQGFFRVKLNLGDRWGNEQRWQAPGWTSEPGGLYNPLGLFRCRDAVSLDGNINGNGSIGIPICIPLVPPTPVVGLQIEGSVQIQGSDGGLQVMLQDLDGDGLADHILKKQGDGNVYVKRNKARKVNLLATVEYPLGGTLTVDYRRQGNRVDLSNPDHRVDMPDNRWVLAEATLDDGRGNTYTTTWDYFNDAYRDRGERVDYGFAKVREIRPDGSTVTTDYHNQDFYRRHLPSKQVTADAAGHLFSVVTMRYDPRPVGPRGDAFFLAEVERATSLYEGLTTVESPALAKTQVVTLDYDAAGNVIREVDFVDEGPEDDTHATVAYQIDPARHIHSPDHIEVRNFRGRLLRQRDALYDAQGNLVRLESTLIGGRDPETGAAYTGSDNPVWTLTYDALGNLVTISDPVGYTRDIVYDAPTRTQVTRVEDSFGYVSTNEWDLGFALPTLTTDEAGASIRREYDIFGRLTRVFAPNELGTSEPTLAFAYYPDERPASAVVRQRDVTRSDPIDVAMFLDGLTRPIQQQKDTEIDQGSGSATRIGRRVSGRQEFDAKGRVAAEGQPVFESGTFSSPLSRAPPFVDVPQTHPTRITWDVLNRVTRARFPQGTETRMDYGIDELDGIRRLLRTRTDAEGKVTHSYFDVTDVIVGIEQTNRIGGMQRQLTTRYGYNAMVELTSVTDPGGNVTSLEYDTLGRRIMIDSPDAGRAEARFDLAGNLGARIPAHLAARGQQIRYLYTFNRLDRIDYPETPDVLYTYGAPGASGFRGNRIATVTDESGIEERSYTGLGGLARTVKTTTALNGRSPKGPWETRFDRDSLGRLLGITYPDGEVLTYGFDAGGLVQSVSGEQRGLRYPYLVHQGYDVFSDRARIVYGNGTETRFTYNPVSRFLDRLLTHEGDGREIQDLRYSYNRVGSVVTLGNDVPLPKPSEHGGPTSQSFVYDDLYQLVQAEGEYRFPPNKRTVYRLDQSYDEIGNLTAKRQIHERIQPSGKALAQKKTSFDWSYVYSGSQPHAVTHLGERSYHYDASGNQTGWDHDRSGRRRTVVWTEESRVRSVADNGRTTRFLYDDTGRRTNKAGPHGETTYVNAYFSVRNGAIGSKHVFADGLRIASQVAQPSLNASPTGPGPEERKRYFFHPDHLGSTHFITDDEGEVYQHFEYFPSGELWVAERSESQRTPYLFAGKELDEETGLSYHGARYYEPRQGQWISPDPIFENLFDTEALEEPDLSLHTFRIPGHLFAYVSNDPVNGVDPDGLFGLFCSRFGLRFGFGPQSGFGNFFARLFSSQTDTLIMQRRLRLRLNREQGRNFERRVLKDLREKQDNVVEQLTIESNESRTRTRVDFAGIDKESREIQLTEAKSGNGQETRNQSKAFPEIERSGATVVGKGKPGFPGGKKIPPTKVEIRREQ